MTAATAAATVTSRFDEDSTATNLPIEISDDFIDIEDDDFLQELGFDPTQAAARSGSFRRTGTLAQVLDGTGDRFVDIGDDLLEDGLLDLEDDRLDVEDDLPQELDFGTAQAATPDRLDVENDLQQEPDLGTAIPAARPVSHTGALSQADSGTTTTKRRGRPPGSRNKRTLQTEAAIAGTMQALEAGGTQGQRDEALQALQAALQGQDQDNVGITQGKKHGRPVGSKDNSSRKKKP